MSSDQVEHDHVDLIDFRIQSPVLPRPSSIPDIDVGDETTLIDTELPIFEQKLQTQCSTNSSQSRRNSVDVEDILINIDSDEFERDSLDGEVVEEGDFLNVCEGIVNENGNEDSVLPVDNFEALLVLKNLDDLLNATLEESEEDITNGNTSTNDNETNEGSEEVEDEIQYVIEECLEDLDNYLEAFDTCETESNLSDASEDGYTNDTGSPEDRQKDFNEEEERSKLRQIEENYRKFVAIGIVNQGYVDSENNGANFTADGRRSSSACAITRKQAFKTRTLNGARREVRPRLIRRKSLNDSHIAPSFARTSGAAAIVPTLDIDSRLFHDVSSERHAHASSDRCTGTVIVEPLQRHRKEDIVSTSAVNDGIPSAESCGTARSPTHWHSKVDITGTSAINETVESNCGRSTWLRSSMRRLQQLTLPHETSVTESGGGRLEVPVDARPVSAPSRLSSVATTSDRSSRTRSRNLVSQRPDGRERSTSSSRSRRRRSVSSSGTSGASSGDDSTLGRMPPAETTVPSSSADQNTTSNSQRRYSFLVSGIVYGALKLQFLKTLEAGRAEEKAKKIAERDARLEEEKRLAAEADFKQIVEVFGPKARRPVKSSPGVEVSEPGVLQASSEKLMGSEGLTPRCESGYETIYSNDDTSQGTCDSSFQTCDTADEVDIFNKPIDFSPDDFLKKPDDSDGNNKSLRDHFEDNDSGYIIRDFEVPLDDYRCPIPPED